MTRWKIGYQTWLNGEWKTMPHAVPVCAGNSRDSAIARFHNVFVRCFGDTLPYRITVVLRQGGAS